MLTLFFTKRDNIKSRNTIVVYQQTRANFQKLSRVNRRDEGLERKHSVQHCQQISIAQLGLCYQ